MSSVIFDNVSKAFLKGTGISTSLTETIYKGGRKLISRLNGRNNGGDKQIFWALKNIDFKVGPGEAFAVVGPNGAGKSTALKLLSRVSWPTGGGITTKGRIACLIELGAGFHPELTGRENVYLYGAIMGMTRKEIKNKFNDIVDFSGVSEFLDTPIKRYSSGMYARLGFSVAIHTEPDILLIDEVLAVGDWAFQQKCYTEMRRYKDKGTTVIFVSHNMDAVRSMCNKGILLNDGQIVIEGQVEEAINGYYDVMAQHRVKPYLNNGNKRAKIISFQLLNQNNEQTSIFKPGDTAIFKYTVVFFENIEAPEFGFFVHRSDSLQIVSTGSADLGILPRKMKAGERAEIIYTLSINLLAGSYTLGFEVRNYRFSEYLDIKLNAVNFQVVENYSHGGTSDLRPRCSINSK